MVLVLTPLQLRRYRDLLRKRSQGKSAKQALLHTAYAPVKQRVHFDPSRLLVAVIPT